jgi:serine/threonine-protein kinase
LPDPDADPGLGPGQVLGKYRIVRQLGAGGMGAVYEAVHTEIAKPVALKTLSERLAADPRAKARFLREAAAASRLDHPHVVDVTDFGSDAGTSFIVMELLRGEDLGALVERHPDGLPVETVADILLPVCAGVFAAHEAGVVHRDLKPQNIFLARTPIGETVPKVLDFGISKLLDEQVGGALTHTGTVIGTTHYLSPEQVSGRPVDGRSDQYALGVILYECATGRRPHEGETFYVVMRSIGEGTFARPRAVRPALPEAFEAIILRAMGRTPNDRFESVHALGQALLPFASAKRRVIWADYFERDRPAVAGARPTAGEIAVPPLAVSSTAPHAGAPGPSEPLTPTRTRPRKDDPATGSVDDALSVGPVPVRGTGALQLPRARRAPILVAAGAVLAVGAVAVVGLRATRSTPPVAAPAASSPAGPVEASPRRPDVEPDVQRAAAPAAPAAPLPTAPRPTDEAPARPAAQAPPVPVEPTAEDKRRRRKSRPGRAAPGRAPASAQPAGGAPILD